MKCTCALALLLATGLACGGSSSPDRYEHSQIGTQSWPAEGVTRLTAETTNGSLGVTAGSGDTITATLTRTCRADTKADAEAHVGDIVLVDNLYGDALQLAVEMPIAGDIHYGASLSVSAPGLSHLDLRTDNGDIEVRGHRGTADAVTANGTIACDLAAFGADDAVTLQTTNGDLTLLLPADASAIFDARLVHGEITVTGFTGVSYAVEEDEHQVGTLGAGEARIILVTTNGNITIEAR